MPIKPAPTSKPGSLSQRSTPGINQSTVNKVYKNTSNSSSYLGNVGKEVKQFAKAWNDASQASNEVGPGTDERANRLRKKQDKAMGQLGGALFLGRKYDDKTGKRVR